ncbi:MAG: glycosyltransferase family A protein [Thermoplasmatales archaeon]
MISVIITAYNRKEFIEEAVRSVLENEYDKNAYEIIVVKNYSDEKIDAFLSFNNIKSIETGDVSIGEQLYQGISQSRGEVICFLDDDDKFTRNKLKTVSSKFASSTDLLYYHNLMLSINDKSQLLPGNIHRNIVSRITVSGHSGSEIARYLKTRKDFTLYSLMFNLSCVSIRRNTISSYIESLREIIDGTDWFIFYCALMSGGKIEFDTEILTYYRVHRSVSNVLTSKVSLREVADFTISKFDKPGHFSLVLNKICNRDDARELLQAKLLEESIIMRILGKKDHSPKLRGYFMYLRLLKYTNKPSMKNMIARLSFIIMALMFPKVTGIMYNMFRRHNIKVRIMSNEIY